MLLLIIMVALACVVFIIADLIPIYKKKLWKQFWTFSVMMALVFLLAALITFDVKVPSPAIPIKNAVMTIFGVYPD